MSASRPSPRRIPAVVAIGGAVLVGVLTAVQARVNGQLGARIGDGLTAAVISFGSGLVVLLILSAVLPSGRRGVRALSSGIRSRSIPAWMLAGGAAGALTVATQGLAVAVIGVSLFTVGVVAGQTVCALVLDRAGYGPGGVVAITGPRLLGAAFALAAVAVSLQGDTLSRVPLWMLVLPFLAGAGIAWQQATNGRLRQKVGTPLTATRVNFIGGTALLLVLCLLHAAFVPVRIDIPTDAWLYTGGVTGVVYIFLSAALVGYTGVLLFGLASVAGQLLTAFALDALWPAPGGPGWIAESIMVLLALIGVLIASGRVRRP